MKSITEAIKVQLDNTPTFFQKFITETIWSRRFVIGEPSNYLIDFLLIKGKLKSAKKIFTMTRQEAVQIKDHPRELRGAKSFPKTIPDQRCFSVMIIHQRTRGIRETWNSVDSVSDRGMGMKKLSVFITKFDPFNSSSLPPINLLHMQKFRKLMMKDLSKIPFLNRKISPFFQEVQKRNDKFDIAYCSFEV
jgi:hypothetical protein